MVSSSNQPHPQTNALLVSSPLILTSSASTSLTPTNVISSIGQHQHQPILQMLQSQQQRPLLFSQPPQMILHGQNGQLLQKATNGGTSPLLKQTMLNHLAQSNAGQQTLLINPNLLPATQQQILINKHLIDSQRGKPIMLAQQPANTAHLQSRSQQPLLSNLQPSLLNQHPFLGQPITWPPNQPPLMAQNSLGQFVLHTPTVPHLLLPNQQQPKGQPAQVQFVQAPASNVPSSQKLNSKGSNPLSEEEASDDSASAGSEIEKANLISKLKAVKRSSKERNTTLKHRQMISNRMMKNQTKKLRITYKPGHKSTQQMNDELLMFEAQKKADLAASSKSGASPDGSKDSLRTMKRKLKLEKKKISIVKPRVVLTHKVNEYLIHESDHPFSVDSQVDEDAVASEKATNGHKLKNADPVKVTVKMKDGKKLRKYRKLMKTKSTSSANGEAPSSSSDLIDISSPANSTSQLQMVELSEDDQCSKSLPALSPAQNLTQNGSPPADASGPSKAEKRNEAPNGTANVTIVQPDPSIYRWSIEDVYRFVLETTSNEELAATLKREHFDGRSLTLLTIPILRDDFDLKLGRILLLKEKINSFKRQSSPDELSDYLPAGGENIFKWSVADVYQFVLRLTSKAIADEFEKQEIDGRSLTLISCENIRNELKISYGPALKIITKINELKERAGK